ncbi:NADH-ubiquinone oxidoreductase chain 1 [Bienertia sinuspersici]
MLSHRQCLGKYGRATCREICTCGSGRGPWYTVLICIGPRNSKTDRAPFDLPKEEVEFVGGYNVEYVWDAILNSSLLAEADVPASRGLILTEQGVGLYQLQNSRF